MHRPIIAATLIIALCQARGGVETLCGPSQHYTDSSGNYTFNPNPWGDDGSGLTCLQVNNDDAVYTAFWKWNGDDEAVHSYPFAERNSRLLPIRLSRLSALHIKVNWGMAPRASNDKVIDYSGLDAVQAKANVAFDLFADTDASSARSTTSASTEIMVWIGNFGQCAPVGFKDAVNDGSKVQPLGPHNFTLFQGVNQRGASVFTWLSQTDLPYLEDDISPLILYLVVNGLIDDTLHVGIMQFGSETFHASEEVRFTLNDLAMDVVAGTPDTSTILSPLSSAPPPSEGPSGLPNKPSGASGHFPSELLCLLIYVAIVAFTL